MDLDIYRNLNAEVNLLSALINKNDSVCDVIEIIKHDDFYDTKHQLIYNAILGLYVENKSIDVITLAEHLKGNMDEIGGITYLSELLGATIGIEKRKLLDYAHIIKDKSNTRKIYKTLYNGISDIKNNEPGVAEKIQAELLEISDINEDDNGDIETILTETIDIIQDASQNGGKMLGIPIGLKIVDKVLNGLNKQDLIILAARPAMGKTAYALNLHTNVAMQNKYIALFNLEMGKNQLMQRILASETLIELDKIKKGMLNTDEWTKLNKATNNIYKHKNNLHVFDKVFTIDGIYGKCKKLKIQHGLNVIVIDYLQLVESGRKFGSREQEVSYMSRRLKMLAKELDITIVCLSQLSRACEQRADRRPMLSDLRESGSIEQDADIVMFLYRDDYYDPESEGKGIIENIIAKHRNGETGTIKLAWLPQYQKIGELNFR